MDNQTLSANVLLASGTEKEIQKQLDRIKNLSVEIQHASLNLNVIKNLQKQLSGQALSVKVDVDASSLNRISKTGGTAASQYQKAIQSVVSSSNEMLKKGASDGISTFIKNFDRLWNMSCLKIA